MDALDASQPRLTVLMFAAGDLTARASLAETYRALGEWADYLQVKNPTISNSMVVYAFQDEAVHWDVNQSALLCVPFCKRPLAHLSS